MKVAVIIPFRLRDGGDPLREANLARVADHWAGYDCRIVVASDGREGDAQFNRSAAYNRGVAALTEGREFDADILVFAESDMIVSYVQIDRAVVMADARPGMVVPFSWFLALSEEDSRRVRAYEVDPADCEVTPVKGHRGSIGAVNVMSRFTLDLVGGWDERLEGWGYDDDSMKIAFDVAAGPTRWVEGSAYHLYHSPGGAGPRLSREDRAATAQNRLRLQQYRRAKTLNQIRALTSG